MRKLIVSMNLSLDGYLSGSRDEPDWHIETWSEAMGAKLLELLDRVDTILLGRITYEAMAKYRPFKSQEQGFPRQDQAIADKMNRYSKWYSPNIPHPLSGKTPGMSAGILREKSMSYDTVPEKTCCSSAAANWLLHSSNRD